MAVTCMAGRDAAGVPAPASATVAPVLLVPPTDAPALPVGGGLLGGARSVGIALANIARIGHEQGAASAGHGRDPGRAHEATSPAFRDRPAVDIHRRAADGHG